MTISEKTRVVVVGVPVAWERQVVEQLRQAVDENSEEVQDMSGNERRKLDELLRTAEHMPATRLHTHICSSNYTVVSNL